MKETESPVSEQFRNRRFCFARYNKLGIERAHEPQETMLLKMAREAGLDTFNGMYMLLYQRAASFKCWTGREMPVDVIKKKYFSHNS